MEFLSKSTNETKKLAKILAKKIKLNDILALKGDLGSGKTTFTNFLVSELGINKRVQSPTFVIHRRYTGGSGEIKAVNHFDLYRITDKDEVENLNLSEFFEEKDSITIIEWPEVAEYLLPKDTIVLNFEYVDENKRKINVYNLH